MKKVILVLLVMLVVFSLTAVTTAAPAKVALRLAWWGNPTRDARTLKAVEMYMAKNPNVTIETETTGWGGYWDKIATQAAANNLPDIMQHDYAYIAQYAQKNLLLDLTPYVTSNQIDLRKVDENFISGGRVNGKLYGINLGTKVSNGSGDPMNSTLVYSLYLYKKAFEYYQMGYGSAMAWVLVLIIAFFTALIFKSSAFWVYYESKED